MKTKIKYSTSTTASQKQHAEESANDESKADASIFFGGEMTILVVEHVMTYLLTKEEVRNVLEAVGKDNILHDYFCPRDGTRYLLVDADDSDKEAKSWYLRNESERGKQSDFLLDFFEGNQSYFCEDGKVKLCDECHRCQACRKLYRWEEWLYSQTPVDHCSECKPWVFVCDDCVFFSDDLIQFCDKCMKDICTVHEAWVRCEICKGVFCADCTASSNKEKLAENHHIGWDCDQWWDAVCLSCADKDLYEENEKCDYHEQKRGAFTCIKCHKCCVKCDRTPQSSVPICRDCEIIERKEAQSTANCEQCLKSPE